MIPISIVLAKYPITKGSTPSTRSSLDKPFSAINKFGTSIFLTTVPADEIKLDALKSCFNILSLLPGICKAKRYNIRFLQSNVN